MEPAAPAPTSPVSAAGRESTALRARRLAAARRRATALLAGVTVLFVAVTAAGANGPLLGYVQAGAEASMVGGVADWFAVTALFRHPLGLKIPHTAIVPARKDRIGRSLGMFVQRNFLAREVVSTKLESAQVGRRVAAWRAAPAPARSVGRQVAASLSGAAQVLRDEDVQDFI